MSDYKLFAPDSYWALTPEKKKEICNGAGPRGFGLVVPDTMYGLNMKDVYDIHDYLFSEEYIPRGGWSHEEFLKANRITLNNAYRKIRAKTKWKWLRYLRERRARLYDLAVSSPIGRLIYWAGKN